MKTLRDSLNSTTIVPIHAERSEVLNFLFRSTLFTHFFRTRNQGQKGTKSILSWKLWPIIYGVKVSTHYWEEKEFFPAVMRNFNELKNYWGAYCKRELECHFWFFGSMIWYVFFHSIFSNEPQIKEESNTYKKRPQG